MHRRHQTSHHTQFPRHRCVSLPVCLLSAFLRSISLLTPTHTTVRRNFLQNLYSDFCTPEPSRRVNRGYSLLATVATSLLTSISVHGPFVFLPGQEFGTPYHPLFMTASHSAALDVTSTLTAFSLLLPPPSDSSTKAP